MDTCIIRKSKVWDNGTTKMDIYEHNKKAWNDGKDFFLYGTVLFMSWYPERFSIEAASTRWFKKDLIDDE